MRRLFLALLLTSFLLVTPPVYASGPLFFPETGLSIEGRFLEYWQASGGLAIFGYPISPVVVEAGEDGVARRVQYFERNRFELHPEKAPPYDVLLGRLGVTSLAARGVDWQTLPKSNGAPGCRFFHETGHSLCEPFSSFWHNHGGLAIFGLPISEARSEVSPTDGRSYTVQYFERNRFEHHPEHPAAFRVQLGLLGSEIYGKRLEPAPAAIDPAMQRLVDLTNNTRQAAGLTPVTISAKLMAVAASYSQTQAAEGGISHIGPDGSTLTDRISRSGYAWSFCAENLAAGYAGPDEVFAAWLDSSGHRANILNPNFREIGVGLTHRDADPRQFFNYWVMVLASPR